jgi:hypothetical protein
MASRVLGVFAALAAATLLAGCGEEPAAPAAAGFRGDPRLEEAFRPTDEQSALAGRAKEIGARLSKMSEDNPDRAALEAELNGLAVEAARASESRRLRDGELVKQMMLEKRRGGAK